MILNKLKNPQKNLAVPFFVDLTLKPNWQFIIPSTNLGVKSSRQEERSVSSSLALMRTRRRRREVRQELPNNTPTIVLCEVYPTGAVPQRRESWHQTTSKRVCGRRPHVTLWYLTLMKYQCSPQLNCTTLSWDTRFLW